MPLRSLDEVTAEARASADSLCDIPGSFEVHERFLNHCDNESFAKGLHAFRRVLASVYRDMAERPEEYGLVSIDRKTGDRKASGERPQCVYQLLTKLSRCCSVDAEALVVDAQELSRSCSQAPKVMQPERLLWKLAGFGFELAGLDRGKKLAGLSFIRIWNPSEPSVIFAIRALSSASTDWLTGDFDYENLNYKVFALDAGERLALRDLYVFGTMSEEDKAFMLAFNDAMNRIGYSYGDRPGNGFLWGTSQFAYTRTGARNKDVVSRVYQRSHGNVVRLFLRNPDACSDYIESLPAAVKDVFTNDFGKCNHCKDVCRHRKTYALHGIEYEKCDGITFEFRDPEVEHIPYYIQLLRLSVASKVKRRSLDSLPVAGPL